ncbi:MAG: carboxypeptidase-like regulatory domain-containing protein [Fodinibius sp.]|nr:carboxypeptidase-like regulatory domain-containing protein [Fodinibius sp.]
MFNLFYIPGSPAELCAGYHKRYYSDSLQSPISNVNIYATSSDSTSIEAFDYSNNNGEYSLQLKLNQPHLLHVSSIGFKKQIINIPAYSATDTLIKKIVLKKEITQLKELVVEDKRNPVITKEDTTIFIADAFTRAMKKAWKISLSNCRAYV